MAATSAVVFARSEVTRAMTREAMKLRRMEAPRRKRYFGFQ